MVDVLPSVVDVLDEPFADASILPTYVLSRFTRESVTVALGGDGATSSSPATRRSRGARGPPVPRAAASARGRRRPARRPAARLDDNFSLDFKLKRFLRGAAARRGRPSRDMARSFTPRSSALLWTERPRPVRGAARAFAEAPTTDRLERLIYLYAKTYLQDDILVKVDRASMACSLEVRAPFLDVELVEFLGARPRGLKLRRFETKHLLKRAMAGALPAGIAGRPKKGFGIPVADWFKSELRERAPGRALTGAPEGAGDLRAGRGAAPLSEHLSGRRDHRKQLWTLFVFQLWHRRWVEGAGHRTARLVHVVPTECEAA